MYFYGFSFLLCGRFGEPNRRLGLYLGDAQIIQENGTEAVDNSNVYGWLAPCCNIESKRNKSNKIIMVKMGLYQMLEFKNGLMMAVVAYVRFLNRNQALKYVI